MRRVEAKRVKKDVQIKLDPAGDMAALDKPVLTLSVSATMVHLKKYIKGQLKLDIPPDAVRNLIPMQDDEFMAHALFFSLSVGNPVSRGSIGSRTFLRICTQNSSAIG